MSIQENLTTASVWMRKDGTLNTVLFISNETLSEKAQAKFPPQVVYTDSEANIFTRSVEDFVRDREFYNINGELESRLEGLFLLDESTMQDVDLMLDDEEDELQVEDKELPAEDKEAPEWQDEELAGLETVTESLSGYTPPVTYKTAEGVVSPFDLTVLSSLTESYLQEPSIADNTIYHKLFIQASAGLTKDVLHSLFTVSNGVQLIPVVSSPAYSPEPIEVDWDIFSGVYFQVHGETTYFVVILGTELVSETADSKQEDVSLPESEVTSEVQDTPLEVESVVQPTEKSADFYIAAELAKNPNAKI